MTNNNETIKYYLNKNDTYELEYAFFIYKNKEDFDPVRFIKGQGFIHWTHYNPIEKVDGITIDGIKEDIYGEKTENVLLDGDRSYSISAVKTDKGV